MLGWPSPGPVGEAEGGSSGGGVVGSAVGGAVVVGSAVGGVPAVGRGTEVAPGAAGRTPLLPGRPCDVVPDRPGERLPPGEAGDGDVPSFPPPAGPGPDHDRPPPVTATLPPAGAGRPV